MISRLMGEMDICVKPCPGTNQEREAPQASLNGDQDVEAKPGRPPGGGGKFNQITRMMGT